MAAPGMRSKLRATTSSVGLVMRFTKEMEEAAIVIQGCFRRALAMKRLVALRRMQTKHIKLAKADPSCRF